jgi:hypothetical protein
MTYAPWHPFGSRALFALLGVALFLSPSLASALPGQLAQTVDTEIGTPSGVAVSADGLIVAVSGTAGLSVVDLRTPSEAPQASESCSTNGAEDVIFVDSSGSERFYVSCTGGGVEFVTLDRTTIPVTLVSSEKITVGSGAGEAIGLAYAAGDTAVFAAIQDSTTYSLDRIPLSLGEGESEPLGLSLSGTARGISIGSSTTPLVVSRSDGFISEFDRSGDVYSTASTTPLFALGELDDVLVSTEFGAVFAADGTNDQLWAIATGTTIPLEWGSGFSDPVALAQGMDGTGSLLWVAEAAGVLSAWDTSEAIQVEIDTGFSGLSGLAVPADSSEEVFVVATDSSLLVVHDRPVLTTLSVDPSTVFDGESFTVSFGAAVPGSWDLRVSGDEDPSSGTSLASGELEADVEASVSLSASDLPSEGQNRLFLFLDDGAETGWDSASVTLDTPPDAVAEVGVGIGDERLYLSWTTSDETDIATYTIYLSDAEFDEDSLPTYSLTDSDGNTVEFPVEVTAETASTDQEHTLDGLTNGVTYFIALHATDEGGLVGALSEVVSGAPAATCGAAECSGDPGCSCSTLAAEPAARTGALLLLVLLFMLVPPRRTRT